MPKVLSMSLGSLSYDSCSRLCTAAAKLNNSAIADCMSYLQSQFQVCMFSKDVDQRINEEFMKLGLMGVTILAASGDGGSHFSFGQYDTESSNLASVLNTVSCNYT